jgi:hypothetical protein
LQRDEPVYVTGKKKVNYQWLLFCVVHNIGKCGGHIGRNTAKGRGNRGKDEGTRENMFPRYGDMS